MRGRRLVLRRETLTELGTEQLALVAGGDAASVPVTGCVSDLSDKVAVCDSLLRPCITWTCTR